MQTVVEQLPCKLTEKEKLLKSDQMAQAHGELERLEEAKKLSSKEFGSTIESKKDLIARLAKEIASGEEIRPIECQEKPRYKDSMVDVVRLDTRDVVRTRPMHPTERQAELKLDGSERPKKAPPMPKRTKDGKFRKKAGVEGKGDKGKGENATSAN